MNVETRMVRGYLIEPRANLTRANLTCADLADANLAGANLTRANLTCANLTRANLTGANLADANLARANLTRADLTRANLTGANLADANLTRANLTGANLACADLAGANLTRADLSQARGLLDASDYIAAHFERDAEGRGIIAYKSFGSSYFPPAAWKVEPGSIISEVVNPCRTVDCGCGVNVATRDWVVRCCANAPIWEVLIRWEWLPGVVVPYQTDGKIRCSRVELQRIAENVEN